MTGFVSGRTHEREGLAVRQYVWLARSRPIRLLLIAWFLSYAGDLAAFTAASVYVYRVGGAAYVGLLGLLKAGQRQSEPRWTLGLETPHLNQVHEAGKERHAREDGTAQEENPMHCPPECDCPAPVKPV